MGWLFTHVMTVYGTCIGWLNPFAGLMVYYAFAILRPEFLWFWSLTPGQSGFSKYVAMSTLFGWFIAGFGDWSGLKGTRIAIFGLVLYLLSGIVGWQLFAIAKHLSWLHLDTQLKIGIMAIATFTLVRDSRSIMIFAWVIVATLGFEAKAFNDWYQISPMYLHNNGFGGIDNNGVGMLMVMAVPLSFFMAVYDRRWWVRLLCFAACAAEVHVVLFSYSRGSQLGLCMVGLAIFLFAIFRLPRKGLTIGCAIIFVGLTLYLAGEGVRERFLSIFAEDLDTSAESRFFTWKAGLNIMADYPLGVGPRNANLYMHEYGFSSYKSIHNLYIQTGADYGWFGLLGLMLFYFSALINCFRMTFKRAARTMVWPFYVGVGVCTSLGGFLTCSIFIGMESVELGFMVSLLGLATVAQVNRVEAVMPTGDEIPELAQVPKPGGMEVDENLEHAPDLMPAYT